MWSGNWRSNRIVAHSEYVTLHIVSVRLVFRPHEKHRAFILIRLILLKLDGKIYFCRSSRIHRSCCQALRCANMNSIAVKNDRRKIRIELNWCFNWDQTHSLSVISRVYRLRIYLVWGYLFCSIFCFVGVSPARLPFTWNLYEWMAEAGFQCCGEYLQNEQIFIIRLVVMGEAAKKRMSMPIKELGHLAQEQQR